MNAGTQVRDRRSGVDGLCSSAAARARRSATARSIGRALRLVAFGLLLLLARTASAVVVDSWGTVSTPIASPVTFSFAEYDVSGNFSHAYTFTLEGSAGATYQVSFSFDSCRTGCGNPVLSYGITGATASGNGSYQLTAGTYAFTVTATGMGAGNTVDYWGSVTISGPAGASVVSPVPEPETYMLIGAGLLLVLVAVRRRRVRDGAPVPAPRRRKLGAAVFALLAPLLLLLNGCSNPTDTRPTQVVARVNGTEISALQVERAARAPATAAMGDVSHDEIVEKLIDRELAVQRALELKLDRQPEVMLRLEELRREVLAGALAAQLATGRPAPTSEAVRSFYAAHPELFAQRKIYHLRELSLPVSSPLLGELKDRLVRRQSLDEIAAWLSREKAGYGKRDVLRAAEQVPLDALATLQRATDGQTVVFEAPRAIYAYQLLGAQPSPLSLAEATPLIIEHLGRQEADRAMASELKTLRAAARVERVGQAVARAGTARKPGS